MSYRSGKNLLEERSFLQLTAVKESKAQQVEFYFENIRNQVLTLSENRMIVEAMRGFKQAFHEGDNLAASTVRTQSQRLAALETYYENEFFSRFAARNINVISTAGDYIPESEKTRYWQYHYIAGNQNPTGEKHELYKADDGSLYSRLHEQYHPNIKSFLEKFGYYDIFLIDDETGHIVYSVFKEVDYGTSLLTGPYSNTNFADAFRAVYEAADKDAVKLEDFRAYTPSYGAPASFIASPIFDEEERIGVLIFQMPVDEINAVLTSKENWHDTGLGESGETYMVAADKTMRSISRFLIEDRDHFFAALAEAGYEPEVIESIKRQETSILYQTIDTEGVAEAMEGRSSTSIIKDYRNVEVLSSFKPLSIEDVEWYLLSEIDTAEAFAPISKLAYNILISAFVMMLLVSGIAVVFARSFVRPINRLKEAANAVAGGDTSIEIPVNSRDEIGELSESFNVMISSLRGSGEKITREQKQTQKALVEAEESKSKAELALHDAEQAKEEAMEAKAQAEASKKQVELALKDAENAEAEALQAKADAEESATEALAEKEKAKASEQEAAQAMQEALESKSEAEKALAEADRSKRQAEQALKAAEQAKEEAIQAKAQAEASTQEALESKEEAVQAQALAEASKAQAEEALGEAEEAKARAESAKVQAENARVEIELAQRTTNEAREELERSVELMLEKIDLFASGDLTVKLPESNNNTINRLFDGFNKAVLSVRQLIEDVNGAIRETKDIVSVISLSSSDILKDVDQQVQQALRITSSAEEMTSTITANAETASNAASISTQSGEVARQGSRIIHQAVDVIKEVSKSLQESTSLFERLGQSSSKIGKTTSVIEVIARQTKLLALNARIEAEQAAEKGMGFAVVAKEVGQLAEQTSSSTGDISTIVQSVQNDTQSAIEYMNTCREIAEKGASLADKALNAIAEIDDKVNETIEMANEIARAAVSQTTTSNEITSSIDNVSQLTQQSQQRVEDIVNSVERLAEQTETLAKVSSAFKTGHVQSSTSNW